MKFCTRAMLVGTVGMLCHPAVARAGMPVVHLTDLARMRVQGISFFLAVLLLSAAVVRLLWNRLARDFTSLPRLTYGKAVGAVVLWGLLFVLVLTMVSGARELMTPGAWEKQGATYRLAGLSAPAPAVDSSGAARRQKLEDLRFSLWEYARTHGGQFPPGDSVPEIPQDSWRLPDPSGMRYVYVAPSGPARPYMPLAYEPELYGATRFVLFQNGEIRRMDSDEIVRSLRAEKP